MLCSKLQWGPSISIHEIFPCLNSGSNQGLVNINNLGSNGKWVNIGPMVDSKFRVLGPESPKPRREIWRRGRIQSHSYVSEAPCSPKCLFTLNHYCIIRLHFKDKMRSVLGRHWRQAHWTSKPGPCNSDPISLQKKWIFHLMTSQFARVRSRRTSPHNWKKKSLIR